MSEVAICFPGWAEVRRRLPLWLLLAALVTALSMQFSLAHGRLLFPPVYDDVGYFLDGLERLEQCRQHGGAELVRGFVNHPPHSPFSTGLALVGFGVFGFQDWAPYALNGLIVLVFLGFVDCLLHGLGAGSRLAYLLFACTLPLVHGAVYEFRPDFAVALLTALGTFLLVTRPLAASSLRFRAVVGALFGLALVVKPSLCPLTLTMLSAALLLAGACDRLLRPESTSLRSQLRACGVVLLVAVLVALPYYLVAGGHVARYIYDNIFGQHAEQWKYPGGLRVQLLYYLTGPGEQLMLNHHGPILLALVLAAVGSLVLARQAGPLVRLGALASALVPAYLVPTATACKHGFYGLTFYFLGVFAAFLALRLLLTAQVFQRRWCRGTLAVGLAGAGVLVLTSPQWNGAAGEPRTEGIRRAYAEIVATIAADESQQQPRVCLTRATGPINVLALRWLARKEGRDWRIVAPDQAGSIQALLDARKGEYALPETTAGAWADLAAYRRELEQADYLVAFQTDHPPENASERLAGATLQLARSLENFVEVKALPTFDGTTYHLFKNVRFGGYRPVEGFGPREGPYPQWGLPVVHWGTGVLTRLQVTSPSGGLVRLALSGRADVPGQAVTVLLDGKAVFESPVPAGGVFTELEVPLVLSPGSHEVALRYAATGTGARSRAVLYRRLQIVPLTGDPRLACGAFANCVAAEGFGPQEGPYPQWDLPVVRWGTGCQTRLQVASAAGGAVRLALSCRADVAGQAVTVLLDGKAVFESLVPMGGAFIDLDVPLALTPGDHEVAIRYAAAGTAPPRTVLYRRLQMLPGCP